MENTAPIALGWAQDHVLDFSPKKFQVIHAI